MSELENDLLKSLPVGTRTDFNGKAINLTMHSETVIDAESTEYGTGLYLEDSALNEFARLFSHSEPAVRFFWRLFDSAWKT
jgi:hypothetical protein